MSYAPAHYNAVFDAMRKEFGESWFQGIDWPKWGVIWRSQIKRMFFDEDILIREMIAGLDEAAGKRRWPIGTGFFHRLQDVCLKNRREARSTRQDGVQRLSDLLPHA